MDKSNVTRGSDDRQSKDGDLEFYLKSGLPAQQIVSVLRSQGKDQKEIDAFLEKYDASRKKIAKVIKKFVAKIESKYGQLDVPDLVKKGMSFATKYNFSQAEKEAFLNLVMRNDVDTPYLPYDELSVTEMSKFLGFSGMSNPTFSVKATDHPALNEIARLYELSKPIHSAIRNNIITYTDFAPETVAAKFDKVKDNVSIFVHPLIVALFLTRIPYLEKRCLYTNFGRLTMQRTQHYFQTQGDKKYRMIGMNMSYNDMLREEPIQDMQLTYDIARDPNSLNYISDETPMSNILKRFAVQIELWKNVLSLRQGKFYSRSENFTTEDNISGLQRVLAAYEWTYFDSPDMSHIYDEGTLLRKILAVFSIRPTLTQISSFVNRTGVGYTNLGTVSRSTFIFTPVCNIKLPTTLTGSAVKNIVLENTLSQHDWFIENKMLVPKNKAVIQSRNVLFFYVNRRFQSPLTNIDMTFNYVAIPTTMTNMTTINKTELIFKQSMSLGGETFKLRSVVFVNPLYDGQLSTGCSSLIVMPANLTYGITSDKYAIYNPVASGNLIKSGSKYTPSPLLKFIPQYSSGNVPGFYNLASELGTVFVYVCTTCKQ